MKIKQYNIRWIAFPVSYLLSILIIGTVPLWLILLVGLSDLLMSLYKN